MNRFFRPVLCALACASVLFAQPANDLCVNATPVFDGVNPGAPLGTSGMFFTNVGAGTEATLGCTPAYYGSPNDVWFTYTATASGFATVSTCNPPGFAFGTLWGVSLSVHVSCGAPELICAPASSSCGLGVAKLVLVMTAGTPYLIRVAGLSTLSGAPGTFYLTITPSGTPPANDSCATPTNVVDGINGPFTNAEATPDGVTACGFFSSAFDRNVWFRYTATATGVRAISTCTPSGFIPGQLQATLAVLSSCSGTTLGCSTMGSCPLVSLPVTAGTSYLIRVASQYYAEGQTGNFFITVGAPAANDECAGALPLSLGQNGPFSQIGSTTSPLATPCPGPTNGTDLWYSFTTGTCPGPYTIDTCDAQVTPSVYPSCPSPPFPAAPLACGYAYPVTACGGSWVTFNASPLTTYRLRTRSAAGYAPAYNITVSQGGLLWSSPGGAGCAQADIGGGPPNGLFFIAVTTNAGYFPYGPLFGISISAAEISTEFMAGYPFAGSLDACGSVKLGPFCGLPSGVNLYSVAFGFAGAYGPTPTTASLPAGFTIP